MTHGIDCTKVAHKPGGELKEGHGWLHDESYDGKFDIDGSLYCGRCHQFIGAYWGARFIPYEPPGLLKAAIQSGAAVVPLELRPVKDGGNAVRGGETHQPGSPKPIKSLTLYSLSSELTDLINERMEMVEAGENTAEIDKQLSAYFAALPNKVDAVAAVLKHMEAQEELATAEVARLNARRRSFASERERLEGYVKDVLAALPDPKRGKVKKLEGGTASLQLWPNGGAQSLDVQDPAMVPIEYQTVTVKMNMADWVAYGGPIQKNCSFDVTQEPDDKLIRKALAENCWDCSGTGRYGHEDEAPCPACGGSGKQGVPGCSLRPRESHLRIK